MPTVNQIVTSLGFVGIGGAVLLLLALFTKIFNKKKTRMVVGIIGAAGLGFALISGNLIPFAATGITGLGAGGDKPIVIQQSFTGDSSTAYYKSYDLTSDAKTQVYPTLFVYDQTGALVENGIAQNSTSTTVGAVLDIYGNSSALGITPKLKWEVKNKAPTVELDAYTLAIANSTNATGYNDVMTVLTTGTNNTDYNMSVGASESVIWYFKIQNTQDNSLYKLGAVCTYIANTTVLEKNEVLEPGWSRVSKIPKSVANAIPAITTLHGTASNIDYYDCYAPSSLIDLREYDSRTIKMRVKGASTDAVENSRAVFGAIAFDAGYSKGKDNLMHSDFYTYDDNEYVGGVGQGEPINYPYGKAVAVAILPV